MIRNVASFLTVFIVLVGMFVFIERTFSTTFQQCVAKNSSAPQSSAFGVTVDSYVRCTGEFIDDNGEAITALATIVIAAFTFTLWVATSRQGQLTKEALIADKRAFVFATGINPQWEANAATGKFDWRIRVTWKNSGDTPTRRMRLHTDCELRNSPLPNNFTFVESIPPGTGLLGPGADSMGGAAHAGTVFVYVQPFCIMIPGYRWRTMQFWEPWWRAAEGMSFCIGS